MKPSVIAGIILTALVQSILAAELDTTRIDEITGLKGKFNEKEGVYKITFPRDDVKVVVDGWTMPPFMGLATSSAHDVRATAHNVFPLLGTRAGKRFS